MICYLLVAAGDLLELGPRCGIAEHSLDLSDLSRSRPPIPYLFVGGPYPPDPNCRLFVRHNVHLHIAATLIGVDLIVPGNRPCFAVFPFTDLGKTFAVERLEEIGEHDNSPEDGRPYRKHLSAGVMRITKEARS